MFILSWEGIVPAYHYSAVVLVNRTDSPNYDRSHPVVILVHDFIFYSLHFLSFLPGVFTPILLRSNWDWVFDPYQ
jgi:hypothetical protein